MRHASKMWKPEGELEEDALSCCGGGEVHRLLFVQETGACDGAVTLVISRRAEETVVPEGVGGCKWNPSRKWSMKKLKSRSKSCGLL